MNPTQALRWLLGIQVLAMGAMEMSGPFWPLHLQSMGALSSTDVARASALAYAGPLVMAMWCTPLWGAVADRTGHKPMLLRALLALALTQAWIAFADSLASVLMARFVQGGLAGFIAAAQAYAARLVGTGERGGLMARLQVATALGSVLGPLAGGVLFDALGFRAVNLLAAALCVVCAGAAWRVLPALPLAGSAGGPAFGDAAAVPAVRAGPRGVAPMLGLLAGIVAVQAARMMPQSFFALYAQHALRWPAWLTGVAYGATATGLCIAAPWWGRRFDRLPRRRVLQESGWAAAACAVLTLLQAPGVATPLLLLARFAWGVSLAALLPVFYGLLSREAPPRHLGQWLGWGNAAAKAGALVGTIAGASVLAMVPLTRLMWAVGLAYVVAAMLLALLQGRGMDDATRRHENGRPKAAV